MNELISVIVPVYNVEKYLKKCIDSIIRQTYKNIEIILVDDGSTDNSSRICDDYKKIDNRIKVIHKKNGGLSDARNVGIQKANGRYIGFVDSDDYIKDDMYEYLYKLIKENDADISICDHKVVYEEEKDITSIDIKDNYKIEVLSQNEAIKKLLLDKEIRSHAWNKLYCKQLFNNVKYPKGKKMEDIGTTYKLFNVSNKIVLGKEKKYYYLQRSSGITRKKGMKYWEDYYELEYERYNFIKDKYGDIIENRIALMKFFVDLYNQNQEEVKQFARKKEIKKIYNEIFTKDIVKNKDIGNKEKIQMILLRVGKQLYDCAYKLYMLIKGVKGER